MNLKFLMTRLQQIKLNREAAKISTLSSKELYKYKYLTGKDLGYKPSVIEKA